MIRGRRSPGVARPNVPPKLTVALSELQQPVAAALLERARSLAWGALDGPQLVLTGG